MTTGTRRSGLARRAGSFVPLVVLLVLSGCGSSTTKTTTTTAATTTSAPAGKSGCSTVSVPKLGPRTEPKPTKTLASGKRYDVTFTTNCGSFTIRLDQAQSPHGAASFASLVQRGFFDKTIFHRIVPGFVIQGGDPTATGTGGPGYTTVDPPPASAQYTHGVVAMAKSASPSAGSGGKPVLHRDRRQRGSSPGLRNHRQGDRRAQRGGQIGLLGNAAQQPTMVIEIEKATLTVSG